MLSQMLDHLRHGFVGGAGRAVGLKQPHRSTVAVHALEPVDTGHTLGDAHRISLDHGLRLDIFAEAPTTLSNFATIAAQLRENNRDVDPVRIDFRQHFADRGHDVHIDRFRPLVLCDGAEDFVRMHRDEIKMVFRATLYHLRQVIDVNGFGGQPNH